jgi:3-isopropylmalate dehydrogenase
MMKFKEKSRNYMIKNIAVLPGDGIGPEIVKESIKVLNAVAKKYGHTFNLEYADFGAESYFKVGHPFPDSTKDICKKSDAIIKGPVGLSLEKMNDIPVEFRPEAGAILPLRALFQTFANFRPIYLPEKFADFSPLKPGLLKGGVDILMIRELIGGIYFGKKVEGKETGYKYSSDDCVYSYEQIAQVAHVAFKEAMNKNKKLFNVHKANVLATSRFWNYVVDEVKKEYPEVIYNSILVDNAAYQLVVNPTQFNGVMLLENMQGDILTDQAGGILGSLGLMPSACVGPDKCYVEPAHGSAPDIAGKNMANPYSMIGSIALMLEKAFGLKAESKIIWDALEDVFGQGFRTPELSRAASDKSKVLSTTEFGDKVADYILKK